MFAKTVLQSVGIKFIPRGGLRALYFIFKTINDFYVL
jgi:hypothetical protein